MNNYTLYIHIVPNNKVYIGITSNVPKIRWGHGGKGYFGHKYFWSAIQKYGWDNIKHEIIATNLTKQEACQMEINMIAKYQSNNPLYGYNLSSGGEFNSGFHYERTPESIERIRKMNTGKKHSEETKKKISMNSKMKDPEVIEKLKASLKLSQERRTKQRLETMKKKYPNGFKQSEESNRKRSETMKGRKKSEETKQKMRKPKSPEHIEHMRQAQKEAWKRRKEN